MVRIRLRRMGAKKSPYYRIVVTDQRSPRDGRFIETIGTYDPNTQPETVELSTERASVLAERGCAAKRRRRADSQAHATGRWPGQAHAPGPNRQRRSRRRSRRPGLVVRLRRENMEELIQFLAQSLVEQPDRVRVYTKETRRETIIKLQVAQGDVGRVVGRNGRVANAMRALLEVAARDHKKPVILEID